MLQLRDAMVDSMAGVAQDTLRSRAEGSEASAFGMHQADAGSDAYDRDFALSLLSQEQDALYEIDQALKRIELGHLRHVRDVGQTDSSRARLEAIPFARFTVECQSQLEKQNKASRVRQSVTSLFGLTEEEGGEAEEEEAAPAAEKGVTIMAQEIITLECTEAKALGKPVSRYMTTRNKKSPRTPNRLEKEEIQSVFETAYASPRDQVIHATKNRQTPFRLSPRQSHHAAPPHRHRHRGDRLQESRSAEEIRHRERQDSCPGASPACPRTCTARSRAKSSAAVLCC